MRDPLLHYDRDGQPISFERWAELFELHDRHIGDDYIGTYRVSTVWIGLDHNFGMTGPPLIFESMVFAAGTAYDMDCRRYATEADAQAGHDELVLLLRATVQDDVDELLDDEPAKTDEQ